MSNYFEQEELHLTDFILSKGKKVKGPRDILKVQPDDSSTPAFGSTPVIKIKKHGDDQLLERARLIVQLSAIAYTPGTFRRFVNAVILFMFKRFELWQNGKQLRQIHPRAVWSKLKYFTSSDKFARICQDTGFDSTAANRNTAGTGVQTFSINLKRIFDIFNRVLDRHLIKDDFEIRLPLVDSSTHIIQTDGTASSCTITDMYLDLHYVRAKPSILKALRENYYINKKVSDAWYEVEYEVKETTFLSGATQGLVDLPSVKGKLVQDIHNVMIANSLIEVVNADYTDVQIAYTSFNIKSSDKFLQPVQRDITTSYYNRALFGDMKYIGERNLISGTTLANEFVISYGDDYRHDFEDGIHYVGGRQFTESDTQVTINVSALAANTRCYITIAKPRRVRIEDGEIKDL